jgi:hypothetical protein
MARRKIKLPTLIGGAVFLGAAAVLIGGLWGFGATTRAPEAPGVCHRMLTGAGGQPRFVVLAKDVLYLETCAAHLERIFLQVGGRVDGAYQGRFIFIDKEAVRSASSLEGSRWRVFFNPQRADLDRKLQQGGGTPRIVMTPAR